ncbi:MAG: amino acid permease, partial [Anaerolineae bacterium]
MERRGDPLTRIRFSRPLSPGQVMERGLSVVVVALAFVLLGDATSMSGPMTPLALALAGLLLLVNFLSYAELATSSPRTEGAYAQIHSTEGGWQAFLTGWMLILGGLGISAMLAQGFGLQMTTLLRDHLDLTIPVQSWAVGLIVLMVVNNLLGTQTARRRLTTLLLVVILLLTGTLLALPRVNLAYFTAPSPHWGRAIPLLLAAFLGLEITTSLQGEMRRRQTHALRTMLLTPTLAIGVGVLVFVVAIGVVGPQTLARSPVPLAQLGMRRLGGIGRPVVLIIGALALALSLNSTLRLVIRQIYIMSKDGYWPAILRQIHPRLGTPTWIIGLVGLLTLPLIFVPTATLGRIAGLIYLLVLMSVNLALIRRPQSAQGGFRLPFHPWIPGLTLAIDLLVLRLWGLAYLAAAVGCLGLGLVLYLTYARTHLIEAQEGVTVFKPPPAERGERGRHRVLVPIANPATAGTLLHLAGTLARQENGEVLALQVIVVPDQVPLEEGRRRAETSRVLLDRAIAQAQKEQFKIQTMTRVAHSVAQGILDTAREEEIDLILLGWRGYTRSFGASMGPVIDAVIRDAPCDVTVAKGDAWQEAKRILVPTAGGPHAPIAARLAMLLSQAYEAHVTALHVQLGRATPEQMEENRQRIARTLNGLKFSTPPEQKVIIAESVVEGIVREAEGYDLVLLGASEEGLFDQFVFGTIPQQIAARVSKTAVIVRRYTGPTQLWVRKLTHGLSRLFPRLNVEEQLELREEMSSSAKPGVNYFVLIVLSSIIATLGLLLDSAAIVIGAMLVAPLMSPILAFSLGMVLSDVRLIRLSIEAIFKGIAMA